MTNENIGTFLAGCITPEFLGNAKGVKWLAAYEKKEGKMTGTWEKAFSLFEQLQKKDLMNLEPLRKQGNLINNTIYMGRGKMIAAYGSSAFLEECRQMNEKEVKAGTSKKYEYVMLPFLGEKKTKNWTLTLPAGYVGLNSALKKEGNEEKMDACLKVMDIISTQKGQEALMKDLRLDNSYLKQFDRSDSKAPSGLESTVKDGYVYYVKFPGKVVEYLGLQGTQYLSGQKSVKDVLAAVDDYYLNGSKEADQDLTVVGTSPKDFIYQNYNTRLKETILGNLVADSFADYSDAPIAVANGGGIRASLYKGNILGDDLKAVCPFDNQILVVKMTGSVLREMLEHSLSEIDGSRGIPGGRFLQVSGITFTYDSAKPVGHRLLDAKLKDGTNIENKKDYTVAITDYMAGSKGYLEGNGDGYTMLNLFSEKDPKAKGVTPVKQNVGTYRDAMQNFIQKHADALEAVKAEGRITDINDD